MSNPIPNRFLSLLNRMERPVLKLGVDQAELSNWEHICDYYKSVIGISCNITLAKLYACLEDDLRRYLQKSSPSD